MDRVLAARPLVGHVLVARFGEDVEQAYRAPEGCWWRGGSVLYPILLLLVGGRLQRSIFGQVDHVWLSRGHTAGVDKDQTG